MVTDPTSAEMIKYASSAYLAAGSPSSTPCPTSARLSAPSSSTWSGSGDGSSCRSPFPPARAGIWGLLLPERSTQALIAVAPDAGYDFECSRAVVEADEEQRRQVADKVRQAAGGLRGRRVGMWVVAAQGKHRRCQQSPAVRIASLLQADGAEVVAYGPEATADLLSMAPDPIAAVTEADVMLIATEWPSS